MEIGDSRSEPPLGPVALLHEISREVGVEVDWLIGNDILGAWVVTLDWPGGEIHFERVPSETVGTPIPVDLDLGVPRLDISVEARNSEGSVGLRSPALVRRSRNGDHAFIDSQSRSRAAKLTCSGASCRTRSGSCCVFFKDRRIVLDFARGRVIDCG